MKLSALNRIKGLKPDGAYTEAGESFDADAPQAEELIASGAAEAVEAEEPAEEEPAPPKRGRKRQEEA